MATGLLHPAALIAQSTEPATAEKIYAADCASCHGTQLQGAQGPPLIAEKYIHGLNDDARSLVSALELEPQVNPATGTREFALRDPDGYYVMVSALA